LISHFSNHSNKLSKGNFSTVTQALAVLNISTESKCQDLKLKLVISLGPGEGPLSSRAWCYIWFPFTRTWLYRVRSRVKKKLQKLMSHSFNAWYDRVVLLSVCLSVYFSYRTLLSTFTIYEFERKRWNISASFISWERIKDKDIFKHKV